MTVALIFMDRFAIGAAATTAVDKILAKYATTTVGAGGLDVGLPEEHRGDREVGRLNIESGRVVYQDVTRINNSIRDGGIFTNEVLLNSLKNVKSKNSTLHLVGYESEYIDVMLKLCKENKVKDVQIHRLGEWQSVKAVYDQIMGGVKSSDSIIFFNHKYDDNTKKLIQAMTDIRFLEFERPGGLKPVHFTTMTSANPNFQNINVAFPQVEIKNTLGEVLSDNDLTFIRLEEQGATAEELARYAIKIIGNVDVMTIDLANGQPDDFKAMRDIGEYLLKITDAILRVGGTAIITATHCTAFCSRKITDVPLIIVGENFSFNKTQLTRGRLCDVAPTILEILNIEKPEEMTGQSLIV